MYFFALEDVAEMAAARRARNLDAPAVGVWRARHGAGDRVEKGWPAAARVEFGCGRVQRSCASGTGVHAWGTMLVVETGPGRLGALVAQHAELLSGEHGAPLVAGFLHRAELDVEQGAGPT